MRTTMRGAFSGAFIQQLGRLFQDGTTAGLTEGELLERFVRGKDEAAFEVLIARHGPMVLGVCRRLLRDPNDVDDAFQATFLVLVRRAGSLHRRDLLGNWLYGVAHRVATRARVLSARRSARAPLGSDAIDCLEIGGRNEDPGSSLDPEPIPWLHEEVRRLPEKYRVPVLLCYFEGLTHEEAAARLGWPIGTVKGRLARARDLLRKRLSRRGVELPASALAGPRLAVPESLQRATLQAARSIAGTAAASGVSLSVLNLTHGVLRAMIATQVKSLGVALLLSGAATAGLVLAVGQEPAKPKEATQPPTLTEKMVKKSGPAPKEKGSAPRKADDAPGHAGTPGGTRGMGFGGGGWATGQIDFQNRVEIAQLASALAANEKAPKDQAVMAKLDEPVTMSFANPTPIDDVLKYIKAATDKDGKTIPIYVDPRGLQQVERTLSSTVMIDLDGVPLKMSLRLLLKQLDLAYCVRDGVLIISSVQGVREELAEAASEAVGKDPQSLQRILQRLQMQGGMGGMGGMGGGGMGMM